MTSLLCVRGDALTLVAGRRFWTLELGLVFIVSDAERLRGARLSDRREQEHFSPFSLAGLIRHTRAAARVICLLRSELPGLHPGFFPAEHCWYLYIQVPSLHASLQCSTSALLAGSPVCKSPDHALHILPVVQTGPSSLPSLATPLLFGHHLCKHGKLL